MLAFVYVLLVIISRSRTVDQNVILKERLEKLFLNIKGLQSALRTHTILHTTSDAAPEEATKLEVDAHLTAA